MSFRKAFFQALKKYIKFMKFVRKGFYCSICNKDYHKYFNFESKQIEMSSDFCSMLVGNTLNINIFRYEYLM